MSKLDGKGSADSAPPSGYPDNLVLKLHTASIDSTGNAQLSFDLGMRTIIVFFGGKRRQKLLDLARALARGMESQGHQVDVVDGERDVNTKLTIHSYIVIGTEAITSFTGKIPDRVDSFLASAGIVAGKRSYAFVSKTALGSNRALVRLMKAMEKEGLFLKNSNILTSAAEAEEIGKRLHIG